MTIKTNSGCSYLGKSWRDSDTSMQIAFSVFKFVISILTKSNSKCRSLCFLSRSMCSMYVSMYKLFFLVNLRSMSYTAISNSMSVIYNIVID